MPPTASLCDARLPSGPFRIAAAVESSALDDFDGLVERYQRRLFRLFLGFTRDPEVADALTQECFLRAWRRRADYRGTGSVESWLLRIACNLLRDQKKSRPEGFWRRLLSLDWLGVGESESGAERGESRGARSWWFADPAPSPEEELVAAERRQLLAAAVAGLPERQRAVFQLRFVDELSLAEIAQALELEVGTVKAHLSRAVSALRRATGGPAAVAVNQVGQPTTRRSP